MTEPDLLLISLVAFGAVMALLALLAGVIRVLMAVFPAEAAEGPAERPAEGQEAALLAAIHSAAALAYPGTRVTRIEEMR